MQLELKLADEFLGIEVVGLGFIVDVPSLDEESLLLLEPVVEGDVGDEDRVEVVEDGLGLAHLLLYHSRAHLFEFVQYDEGVGL